MSEDQELESGARGKQGELHVFGVLLERGFSLYTPMLDWTGIDCVVDAGDGKYKEIQIKTRTKNPFFQMRETKPRDNLFIICYLTSKPELWVIPSKVFFEMGTGVKRAGKSYVRVTIGKEGSESYEHLREYRDNFHLLTAGATPQVKKAVEQATRRIAEEHLTQADAENAILSLLDAAREQNDMLSTKEIVESLWNSLRGDFSPADLVILRSGRARWEATLRFAIYQGLKKKGFIESIGKNQWVITEKGRDHLASPWV
jgi:hypothetical protein